MSPLITAAELDQLLGAVTVLDVRYRMGGPGGPGEYQAGHIPGAAYVDLDTDLAAPPSDRGRHPLPDDAVFEAAMRRVGVSNDRPVVVYDDWEGRAAARCWWLLRHHGHPDVRVLDGGWSTWQAVGGAVEDGVRLQQPGTFTSSPGCLAVVEVDEVLDFARRAVLVDARNPERYRGDVEPVDPVAGHIPGAVNVPTGVNLRADGTFRARPRSRRCTPSRAPPRMLRSVSTAGPASPPRTTSLRSRTPGSTPRSTRAPGANGSPIRPVP